MTMDERFASRFCAFELASFLCIYTAVWIHFNLRVCKEAASPALFTVSKSTSLSLFLPILPHSILLFHAYQTDQPFLTLHASPDLASCNFISFLFLLFVSSCPFLCRPLSPPSQLEISSVCLAIPIRRMHAHPLHSRAMNRTHSGTPAKF